MPSCPRCSHENSAHTSVCSGCGAQLPRLTETLGPSLELREGTHYLTPQHSYSTEYLFQLAEAVAGGEAEQVELWLKLISKNLQEFTSGALPRLRSLLDMERFADPDTEFPDQVQYLVTRGLSGYEEGLATMRSALEAEDRAALEQGLAAVREGNDNLCLGLGLMADRKAELEKS